MRYAGTQRHSDSPVELVRQLTLAPKLAMIDQRKVEETNAGTIHLLPLLKALMQGSKMHVRTVLIL